MRAIVQRLLWSTSFLGRRSLSFVTLVSMVLISLPSLATACEDRDVDGFAVGVGCGVQDCNDSDVSMNPNADEICNGQDDDCNGFVDDNPECDRTCDNPEKLPVIRRVSLADVASGVLPEIVWAGDGWVVAWSHFYDGVCSELRLQRLDPNGELVGVPVTVSGGVGANVQPQHVSLAWNGTELAVAWLEAPVNGTCSSVSGEFHAFVRLLDQSFQPISAAIQLDCGVYDSSNPPTIAWGSSRFGAVWPDDGIQFSTVDRDGHAAVACGMTIGPPVLEAAPHGPWIAWDGGYYGVTWEDAEPNTNYIDIHQEIYFRRVDEGDISPDVEPTRITYDPGRSEYSSLAWADGEWGVAWADTRDNPGANKNEIYIARLDPTGSKVEPPGDIRASCCNTATDGDPRRVNIISWTGEEYAIAYLDENHPTDITGDVLFQRIDSGGNLIGDPVLVTDDSKYLADWPDMAWNGEYYGIVWEDKLFGLQTKQIYFARVGCNCTDNDGDFFSTCAGGDCLDNDPLSHPLATESCLDGKDNNCDGPIDCQDTVACAPSGGSVPGEVGGLYFGTDKTTLDWQTEPGSDVYDLMTGNIAELRSGGDFSRASCLAWREPLTSFSAGAVPIPGEGYYYLVRGKSDQCMLGTWGSPSRDDARLTCP